MHYRRFKLYGDPNYVTRIYAAGKTTHPLISVYKDMLKRCQNQNDSAYHNYGGRGIKVCDRWLGKDGFMNFVSDIGDRPNGTTPSGKPLYTLDRIDPNGDYCPENCRWATWTEQASNRRGNIYVYLWGEKYTLSKACHILGLKTSNVHSLLGKRNKNVKRAVEDAVVQGIKNHYKERVVL